MLEDEGHQYALGVVGGSSSNCLVHGELSDKCSLFAASPSRQNRILQNVPRVIGGRLSRIYPIPRLAGQQTQYIENQLHAYIEGRRKNSYMYNVAHVLSQQMQVALARHFSGLNSRPLVSASRALVATGKTIYEDGDPNSNVPACMACHGGDAKGHEEIPPLAGQLPDYIFNKLVNWNKERGQDQKRPDISAIMLPTSHNLTKSQIQAIAAYVNRLE